MRCAGFTEAEARTRRRWPPAGALSRKRQGSAGRPGRPQRSAGPSLIYAPPPRRPRFSSGGLAAGERTGASSETVRCLGQLAWARWLLGDTDEAQTLATRGEELLGRVGAPEGGAFLFGAHAYAATARVLLGSGAPDRGENLLRPVLEAAKTSGWREAAATSSLVLGLCLEARGELDQARTTLTEAATLSDEHGIPAPSWEAHTALARLGEQSIEHMAAAEAIVERMGAGLKDEAERDRLRERLSL